MFTTLSAQKHWLCYQSSQNIKKIVSNFQDARKRLFCSVIFEYKRVHLYETIIFASKVHLRVRILEIKGVSIIEGLQEAFLYQSSEKNVVLQDQ